MTQDSPRQAEPTPFEILQNQSLTMLVRQEIERMINGGELGAGAKLSENAIAMRLGVSRGPVREALRALEQTGLVRVEKNRGVFVRQIALAEADDIYELRAVLDQLVGRRLAERITAEQTGALRALIEQMEKAAANDDVDAYHPLNLTFHDSLVEFAGNNKLLHTYRRLVNELNLFRRQTLTQRDRLPLSTREHKQIVEAIASGDADAAGRLLYEHAMTSRERMHQTYASGDEIVVPLSPKAKARTK